MDLTLSYYRAFVAGPTNRDRLRDAFRSVGAVRCSIHEGWYDLPPEPIWARLPYSPDHEVSGLSPNLRALGTARLRLRLANHVEGYSVLAVTALVALELELEVRDDVDWREVLVPAPGRAVLQGKASKLDPTELAELIAHVASTGRGGSDALSLRVICNRRTAFLQESLEKSGMPLVPSVHLTRLGVSAASRLYIDGSSVHDCEMPTAQDLVLLASEVAINRAILDFLEQNLKATFSKLHSSINQPDDRVESNRRTEIVDWIAGLQNEMQFVATGLSHFSHVDSSELLAIFNRRLSIPIDLNRCLHRLDQLHHSIGWQMVLGEAYISRRQLSASVEHIDAQISDTRIRLEVQERQWSRRFSTSIRAMCLALGVGLFVIAISHALNIEAVGYALAGTVFAVLGLITRACGSAHSAAGSDSDGQISTIPPSGDEA